MPRTLFHYYNYTHFQPCVKNATLFPVHVMIGRQQIRRFANGERAVLPGMVRVIMVPGKAVSFQSCIVRWCGLSSVCFAGWVPR